MSVKVMAHVWDLPLPKDEKFILLAYADHADHAGNNMFPAVETVANKTGYSERSVQYITRKLEDRGLLLPAGAGPHGTNKWSYGWGATIAPVQTTTGGGANHDTEGVQPIAPEPSLEPSVTITEDEEVPVKSRQQRLLEERENQPDKKKGDLVDAFVTFSQTPQAAREKRLEDVQYRISKALNINPSWDRWERFVKFADKMEQDHGQTVEVFFRWLKAKPNFDIGFWPPDKMQEVWPQAFVADPTKTGVQYTPGKAFKG